MIPNMTHVVKMFEQSIQLKTATQTIVDFEPVETFVTTDIQATVQTADKEKLKVDNVDWSKRYLMVHTPATFGINDFVVYEGGDYKIIDVNNSDVYGYYEAIAEEVK